MPTKKELKDRAQYGRNLADLLMLKAMNMSTPEVKALIRTSSALNERCDAVLTDEDSLPIVSFEKLAEQVDEAEQLLTQAPTE